MRLKQRGPDTIIVTLRSSSGNQTTIIPGICPDSTVHELMYKLSGLYINKANDNFQDAAVKEMLGLSPRNCDYASEL